MHRHGNTNPIRFPERLNQGIIVIRIQTPNLLVHIKLERPSPFPNYPPHLLNLLRKSRKESHVDNRSPLRFIHPLPQNRRAHRHRPIIRHINHKADPTTSSRSGSCEEILLIRQPLAPKMNMGINQPGKNHKASQVHLSRSRRKIRFSRYPDNSAPIDR